ncbi:hypothetical protein ASG30_17020 [Ramlibacter sp. Leaf400]|nr:hypothetical protein ASG30_17020 [Ramlibacter sp. Leaf400]
MAAGASLTFNSANSNLVSVTDPDSATLTTVLTLSAGTMMLSSGGRATIGDNGTGEVTVSGTIADINVALDGMVFTAPDSAQTVILQIRTEDASTPTALSDTDEITLTITAVQLPGFQNFEPAVNVLGQPNFASGSSGPPTQRNLLGPRGAVAISESGRIYVPDTGHNRVLVFSSAAGPGSLAQLRLGQPSFSSGGARIEQGSHPEAAHVAIGDGRMAVAEPFANRISLYASVPTSTTQMPVGLLGQHSFDGTLQGCNGRTLNQPSSVAITPDAGKVLVADRGNSRVTIYNFFPLSVGTSPAYDVSLGQTHPDCVLDPTPSSASMNQPTGVWTNGTQVVVADTGNHRVLIWNTFPSVVDPVAREGESAHRVLGQSNFTASLPNRGNSSPGAGTLNAPTHVASDGTRLAVADTGNHRVLIWDSFPNADGVPANRVLGQIDFDNMLANNPDQDGDSDGPSERVFFSPGGLLFHNGKLYVTDKDNNRILVFDGQ